MRTDSAVEVTTVPHFIFSGNLAITPALQRAHYRYLREFAGNRHVMRHEILVGLLPDPVRTAVGLPVGLDGGYFVGARGHAWDESIKNPHIPPTGQPSPHCPWEPVFRPPTLQQQPTSWATGQTAEVQLDWLRYLVEHFLRPWGYTLQGELAARDASGATGQLRVHDTQIGLFWDPGRVRAAVLPTGTPARAVLPLLAAQGGPPPELPRRRLLRRPD